MKKKRDILSTTIKLMTMAYRSFLGRLAIPLQAKLSSGDTGLDFGCGHGPALADMLEEGWI